MLVLRVVGNWVFGAKSEAVFGVGELLDLESLGSELSGASTAIILLRLFDVYDKL